VIKMNKITKDKRSAIMKAIKSKDTTIEVLLRKSLWHSGIRYRKNYKTCNCNIDIAITKYKIAIFCDGDFWHGNDKYLVKTNTSFWNNKIRDNVDRDLRNTIDLRDHGWSVLRFWGSEIKANPDKCIAAIVECVKSKV